MKSALDATGETDALIVMGGAVHSIHVVVACFEFDFMGGSFKDKQAAAETIPGGPAYAMLQEQAKKHGIFIHAGSILERIEGEARVGNTTVVFDRQGGELARVLCVVHCALAEKHPALLAWYDACVHFSDVVLLQRREGVANKWVSDFLKHYQDQFMPCLFETVKAGLARMNAEGKGSSMRVQRVLLMTEAPSVDGHEITDKGYINQRATLERRKALVEKIYAGGPGVIEIP